MPAFRIQKEGTLGRTILEGHDPVRIHGKHRKVKARIEKINGMSAHADRTELLRWLGHLQSRPGGSPQLGFRVVDEATSPMSTATQKDLLPRPLRPSRKLSRDEPPANSSFATAKNKRLFHWQPKFATCWTLTLKFPNTIRQLTWIWVPLMDRI